MNDNNPVTDFLRPRLAALPAGARVLDVGGWFKPLVRATHVVDIMPYQTRRGRLQLTPLPGENFRADTWFHADFLAPTLRLPFPDEFFDFAYCGQTVEDLTDPEPLLREMDRVARAGVIESPSRLVEQTTGIRDRIVSFAGHPHHHWILDVLPERLELCSKSPLTSLPSRAWAIPLVSFERRVAHASDVHDCHFAWTDRLSWSIVPPEEARRRAIAFRASVAVRPSEFFRDPVIRHLRGLKSRLLRRHRDDPTAWFKEMLRLSEPFQKPASPA